MQEYIYIYLYVYPMIIRRRYTYAYNRVCTIGTVGRFDDVRV